MGPYLDYEDAPYGIVRFMVDIARTQLGTLMLLDDIVEYIVQDNDGRWHRYSWLMNRTKASSIGLDNAHIKQSYPDLFYGVYTARYYAEGASLNFLQGGIAVRAGICGDGGG